MIKVTPIDWQGGLHFTFECSACGNQFVADSVPWDDICPCQKRAPRGTR